MSQKRRVLWLTFDIGIRHRSETHSKERRANQATPPSGFSQHRHYYNLSTRLHRASQTTPITSINIAIVELDLPTSIRHHASHIFHAPVARSHRVADPEPAAARLEHQDQPAFREEQSR